MESVAIFHIPVQQGIGGNELLCIYSGEIWRIIVFHPDFTFQEELEIFMGYIHRRLEHRTAC